MGFSERFNQLHPAVSQPMSLLIDCSPPRVFFSSPRGPGPSFSLGPGRAGLRLTAGVLLRTAGGRRQQQEREEEEEGRPLPPLGAAGRGRFRHARPPRPPPRSPRRRAAPGRALRAAQPPGRAPREGAGCERPLGPVSLLPLPPPPPLCAFHRSRASAASDVRFPGGFFTWQSPDNFGENLQRGWESWELSCKASGSRRCRRIFSIPRILLPWILRGEGGGWGQRKKGGWGGREKEKKEPRNCARIPAAAPRPRSALPSLHNALAGDALPGLLPRCWRRASGTPAAARRRRLRVRARLLRGGARCRGAQGRLLRARGSAPPWKSFWGSRVGRGDLKSGDLFKGRKKKM